MELKTYGELKKLIKLISLKQKGQKILSQGKELALDQLLGLIPGASNVKTAFDFLTTAFKKPDTVKTNTWLDRLDVDDKMSAIIDDTVENGFLQFLSRTLEAAPDEKPLQPDFNMNQQMADYLQKNYSGRFVAGIKESTNYNKRKMNKVLINESQLRAMVRKMLMEETPMGSTPVGSTGGFAPQGTAPSSLATNATKQSTTLQSQRNTQQNKTLSQVDNLVKLNGQFINMMNGVNKEKINPSKFNKQTLITNFTKLLTDLGYK
jgi:hypothetical protein